MASCGWTSGRAPACSSAATSSTASSRPSCSFRATASIPTCARKVGELIAEAYGGKVASFEPAFRRRHDGAGAFHHRRATPTRRRRPTRTSSKMRSAPSCGPGTTGSRRRPQRLSARWRRSASRNGSAARFRPGYRELYSPQESLEDIAEIDRLSDGGIAVAVWRSPEDGPAICRRQALSLSASRSSCHRGCRCSRTWVSRRSRSTASP